MLIEKIISGGQTGVDRGALDFALENSITCAGWCPKGRLSEDGVIPDKYPLWETKQKEYPHRTEKNILNSDGTFIIIKNNAADRGTELTGKICRKNKKPYLKADSGDDWDTIKIQFKDWLKAHKIKTLNIAGNRESFSPGIQAKTKNFLEYLFNQ